MSRWTRHRAAELVAECWKLGTDEFGQVWSARRRVALVFDSAVRHLGLRKERSRRAEVLALIAVGLTDKQIAIVLACSAETVSTHVTRLFQALGVRTRPEAVAAIFEAAMRSKSSTEAQLDDPWGTSRLYKVTHRIFDPACGAGALLCKAVEAFHPDIRAGEVQ